VLVLPDVDATTAIRIAEEARARIARHPWSRLRLGLRVTVGVGLAHETFSPEGRPDAGRGFEAATRPRGQAAIRGQTGRTQPGGLWRPRNHPDRGTP
jgi:hypothetical protein